MNVEPGKTYKIESDKFLWTWYEIDSNRYEREIVRLDSGNVFLCLALVTDSLKDHATLGLRIDDGSVFYIPGWENHWLLEIA